jgi:hypothetical protein
MKNLLSVLFFFLAASASLAQDIMKNKKITSDELPIVISASFKKDFPQAEGTWSVFYTQQLNGSAAVLTPKWYIFSLKGDNKSIAQYSPSGKLERSKGLESKTTNTASKGSN